MKILKLLVCLLWLVVPVAGWSSVDGPRQLQHYYQQVKANQAETASALPFDIYSNENDNRLSADVYSVVEQPFYQVTDALTDTASWCEFMPLNLNIKSCVIQHQAGQVELTFYAGRKYYEEPEDAYQLHYIYHVEKSGNGYLKVRLDADEGPFGTSDYRIIIEAIPVERHTFVRIHSSYMTSLRSRLGTEVYLATLGRDKVGFSAIQHADTTAPAYIKGIRGIIERNVMRYYLALKAFLDTANLSKDERFEARLKTWYDLTENYATQLHELERDDYLNAKRHEWLNQQRLQQASLGSDEI
jgi:hypothetical protein